MAGRLGRAAARRVLRGDATRWASGRCSTHVSMSGASDVRAVKTRCERLLPGDAVISTTGSRRAASTPILIAGHGDERLLRVVGSRTRVRARLQGDHGLRRESRPLVGTPRSKR